MEIMKRFKDVQRDKDFGAITLIDPSLSRLGLAFRLVLGVAFFSVLSGPTEASPKFGDDCVGCHTSADALPASHPRLPRMSSELCRVCHVTETKSDQTQEPQDKTQQQVQNQQQDRTQDRNQDQRRDQTRTRRQIVLSKPPGTAVDGFHGTGDKAQKDKLDPWSYRLNFGLLYSSDIEEHRSGSLLHGKTPVISPGSGGGDHGLGHHEDGEGESGYRIRLGGRAIYTTNTGDGETLAYNFMLNADLFPEEDLQRYVARFGLDWKRKTDTGNTKVSPYLQRTIFDNGDETDKTSFYALGLNFNYHYFLSPTSTLSYSFHAKQRKFDGESDTRRADLRTGLAYSSAFAGGRPYRVGASVISRENPKKDENRYFGPMITAATSSRPTNDITLGWLGEIGHRRYKGPDPSSGITREDDYVGLGLSYQDKRLEVFSASPTLLCHYRVTNSNVAEYDKDTGYCAIFIERRF